MADDNKQKEILEWANNPEKNPALKKLLKQANEDFERNDKIMEFLKKLKPNIEEQNADRILVPINNPKKSKVIK